MIWSSTPGRSTGPRRRWTTGWRWRLAATGLVSTDGRRRDPWKRCPGVAVKRVTDGLLTYANDQKPPSAPCRSTSSTDPDLTPTQSLGCGALVSAPTATWVPLPMVYDAGDGQTFPLAAVIFRGTTLWCVLRRFHMPTGTPSIRIGTPGPVNGTVLATGTTEEQARSILLRVVERAGPVDRCGHRRAGWEHLPHRPDSHGDGRTLTLTPSWRNCPLGRWRAKGGKGRQAGPDGRRLLVADSVRSVRGACPPGRC